MPRITETPKNRVISFRTSDSMTEALERVAKKEGKSLSELVRFAFEDWMGQHSNTSRRSTVTNRLTARPGFPTKGLSKAS